MAAYLKKPFSHNPLIARKPLIRVRYMRGSSTGDPASHRTQDKRSHPASGAQAGTGRSALRPETVAEMRGASEKRPSDAIMPGRRLRIQPNLGQRNKPLPYRRCRLNNKKSELVFQISDTLLNLSFGLVQIALVHQGLVAGGFTDALLDITFDILGHTLDLIA